MATNAGKGAERPEHESVPVERGASAKQPRKSERGSGAMARRDQQQQLASPGMMHGLQLPHLAMPPTLWRDPFGLITRSGGFGLADRLLHDLEDDVRAMTRAIMGDMPSAGQQGEEGDEEAEAERALERLWAAVDVKETPTSYELSTDVPGLSTDDVKVTLEDDNILKIAGERRREEETQEAGFKRIERSYGSFERRFKLPASVEPGEIKASLEHGVLRVAVPKKEQQKEAPKDVPIQVHGGNGGSASAGSQA